MLLDMQIFTLFIKLVREDYKLSEKEVTKLSRRMMADEREFSRVWEIYQRRAKRPKDGVDEFKPILSDLLSE